MSERITWETCPECGDTAAVGWRLRTSENMHGQSEEPVEADCPNSCTLSAGQVQEFGDALRARRRP